MTTIKDDDVPLLNEMFYFEHPAPEGEYHKGIDLDAATGESAPAVTTADAHDWPAIRAYYEARRKAGWTVVGPIGQIAQPYTEAAHLHLIGIKVSPAGDVPAWMNDDARHAHDLARRLPGPAPDTRATDPSPKATSADAPALPSAVVLADRLFFTDPAIVAIIAEQATSWTRTLPELRGVVRRVKRDRWHECFEWAEAILAADVEFVPDTAGYRKERHQFQFFEIPPRGIHYFGSLK